MLIIGASSFRGPRWEESLTHLLTSGNKLDVKTKLGTHIHSVESRIAPGNKPVPLRNKNGKLIIHGTGGVRSSGHDLGEVSRKDWFPASPGRAGNRKQRKKTTMEDEGKEEKRKNKEKERKRKQWPKHTEGNNGRFVEKGGKK